MNALSKIFLIIGLITFIWLPFLVLNWWVEIFQNEDTKIMNEIIKKAVSNKWTPDEQIKRCKEILHDIGKIKENKLSSYGQVKLLNTRNSCEWTIDVFEWMIEISKIDALRLYKTIDIEIAIKKLETYLNLIKDFPLKQAEAISGMTGGWSQEEILRKWIAPIQKILEAQLELLRYQLSIQKSLWLNEDGTIYIENDKIREKYNSLAEKVQKASGE